LGVSGPRHAPASLNHRKISQYIFSSGPCGFRSSLDILENRRIYCCCL